jgi:hypothetical protein
MNARLVFFRQFRGLFSLIAAASLGAAFVTPAWGQLYVATQHTGVNDGTIGEYTSSGSVMNPSLITGLNQPDGLASDGMGDLFVANMDAIG